MPDATTTTTTTTTTTSTTTTTTTVSTTTTTTLLPARALEELANFIDVIYPRYILDNNKYPFDVLKLGASQVFSLVQTSAIPTWLDLETPGITAYYLTSNSVVVSNFREPEFTGVKIYINDSTEGQPIVKNNQIFSSNTAITSFRIQKADTINGLNKNVILYSNLDIVAGYDYAIHNAYCDVYERIAPSSPADSLNSTRKYLQTLPIYKISDNSRKNYKFVVDFTQRNLFENTITLSPDVNWNENYQLEIRFKNSNGSYELQGNYSNITKLPTDYLIQDVDSFIRATAKNVSSLETITETLILLAKLKYAAKVSGVNYVDDYFNALLNTLYLLPRVSNLFYNKYTFNEALQIIEVFDDLKGSASNILLYPNLYMACRFLESKDPDLVNFAINSGLVDAIYGNVEMNQSAPTNILNFNNLIREGFEVRDNLKSYYRPFFVLKDQILLYILYSYLTKYENAQVLLDKINATYVTTTNQTEIALTESNAVTFYPYTTLDYVWAKYFYSSLNQKPEISLWASNQIAENFTATNIKFEENLTITNGQENANYNADYVINFINSPYPKTALTFDDTYDFAYTPFTIIDLYLQRTAVQGNFLNNYETEYGVVMANRGSVADGIYVVPSLFSTVMQILSKIAPTDYFALKTQYLTTILPQTEMNVNWYAVANGVLVAVNLQHELGLVALSLSPDGSTIYDKQIITSKSRNHSFVLNAPKTSPFIININPTVEVV